ncbi:cbb3-type cytochrome c oxidase N-terminal domain-containing protein [uncultured Rubinisphaera sp.]|uniref:cbb3-type cytochrome c oxidase N-terminal domain-containing protein n=1 Tax=uncultured Rubinisphaera sp. TaxID=1678686 RepID=UPI0030DA16DC
MSEELLTPNADNELTGHNYDGIQEYDNPLPGWWKMLFIGSIVYGVLYMVYYHNGQVDRSMLVEYQQAVAANLRLQFSEIGELNPDRETLLTYMDDVKWSAVGESVFKTHCVSCHGSNGEGKIGPNLTDDKWKNVKTIEDIAKVVSEGAGNNAMPAWKTRLHPNELVLVSAYVASLRGTNPGAAKSPIAGEKSIPPWDEPQN